MRGLSSILSLFLNDLNKLINTRARMLDTIYHVTEFSFMSKNYVRNNVMDVIS